MSGDDLPVLDDVVEAAFGRLGPLDGRRLLEVGCRAGANLRRAVDLGAVVWGVDASASQLRVARLAAPGADLRVGTTDDLPFDSGSFDVVCVFGRLAGTHDVTRAVGELARVCRRGGVLLVVVDGPDDDFEPGSPRVVILST